MSETLVQGEPAEGAPGRQRLVRDDAGAAPALGLIGLHAAGRAIALTLVRSGRRLLACDPDADCCRAYAEAAGPDADVTDVPAEVGQRCGIVVLAGELGADVELLHGALGAALPAGGLVIDMGPAVTADVRRLAAELTARGLRLVDAPMLAGSPPIVLIGGAPADAAEAQAVLGALGPCVLTGPAGSARAVALLNAAGG